MILILLLIILIVTCSIIPRVICESLESSSIGYGLEGEWQVLQSSIGISAMHMQLLNNDKVIMFDRTDFGASNLPLPNGRCRMDGNDRVLKLDCTAHSVLYDIATNTFRPLMVQTDTWCSSGSVLPNGTLVQTGGFNDGDRVLRTFTPCSSTDNYCDWTESPNYLSQRRWYATNQILPDGRIIVIGGRRQFNYEFYPKIPNLITQSQAQKFPFLQETTDPNENNLYPFVHLLPDGNLFVFANTRSVLLDYNRNRVVKEFPPIPGGDPRNYPSSGSSVLLPLDENDLTVEIVVCGGAPRGSSEGAMSGNEFVEGLNSCGRIKVSDQNPGWVMETMPLARVMGDMILLPTGEVIIINGVAFGTAGWERGRQPVLTPVIFRPSEPLSSSRRFAVMSPASRPRLYHSTAILLKDGRVLVGGSNPHIYYNFTNVEYPTDLSLEAFSPPYLSPMYDPIRPIIRYIVNDDILGYKVVSYITFTVQRYSMESEVSVRIVAPSFSTHSFGMNQRMVVLKMVGVTHVNGETYYATVVGPSTAEIAPPGYYLLFVVHSGVPSSGTWVHLL